MGRRRQAVFIYGAGEAPIKSTYSGNKNTSRAERKRKKARYVFGAEGSSITDGEG